MLRKFLPPLEAVIYLLERQQHRCVKVLKLQQNKVDKNYLLCMNLKSRISSPIFTNPIMSLTTTSTIASSTTPIVMKGAASASDKSLSVMPKVIASMTATQIKITTSPQQQSFSSSTNSSASDYEAVQDHKKECPECEKMYVNCILHVNNILLRGTTTVC